MELFRALKVVIKKDSNYHRNHTFNELKSRTLKIQIVEFVFNYFPFLRTFLVHLYGIKSYIEFKVPKAKKGILAIYCYENEKRQMDYLSSLLPKDQITIIKSQKFSFPLILNSLEILFHRKTHSISKMIVKRYGLLVSLRALSTLYHYANFKRSLAQNSYKGVLVSSDTNPYSMGITWSAKSLGIKTLYINHGHIPEGPPRLFFDYSFLDGPGLKAVYDRSGEALGKVIYKGSEGQYRSLNLEGLNKKGPKIGIFLSLITDWDKIFKLTEEIKEKFKPSILILRLHPNKVIRNNPMVDKIKSRPLIKVSYAETCATDDLRECDFVIVGNASVHLTSLKFGVPTIHVRDIDDVEHDFYLFIKNRIHPFYEKVEDINLEEVQNFYKGDWEERFSYFDSNYKKSPLESEQNIKQVFREVLQ